MYPVDGAMTDLGDKVVDSKKLRLVMSEATNLLSVALLGFKMKRTELWHKAN